MKVLVIQLSPLGDVVRAIPVIAGLRKKYIGCDVHILTEDRYAPLFQFVEGVHGVIPFRRMSLKGYLRDPTSFPLGFKKVEELITTLSVLRFDICINLHNTLLSAYLTFATKSKTFFGTSIDPFGQTIGHGFYFERDGSPSIKHGRSTYVLYEERVQLSSIHLKLYKTKVLSRPRNSCPRQIIDQYLTGCDLPPAKRYCRIKPSPHDLIFAKEFLKGEGVGPSETLIGVQPTSLWASRRWGEGKFSALLNKIHKKWGFRIIIFGTMRDEDVVKRILRALSFQPIVACGKTDLRQLAALIYQCTLFITNNTGPMHLAAALGIRTLCVFGATSPQHQGPYGDDHLILCADLPCLPCGRSYCEDHLCMDLITPEDVFASFERMITMR